MKFPTTEQIDSPAERMLASELSMLIGNAASRIPSVRNSGFTVPFEQFKSLCDGDARLARRVLLRTGWIPAEDGEWILGKGRNSLEKAIPIHVLEEVAEDIFDDYRPLDDDHSRDEAA